MKKLIILIAFSLAFSCSQKNADSEWFMNGNLHNATVSEWQNADDQNKLATCADFAAKLKEHVGEKYQSMEEMKYDAEQIKACIDEAIKGGNISQTEKISAIAVGCKVIMESEK